MFNPISYEKEIVQFWKDTNVRQKWKEATKNGKKFYFLQGPPYTSGRIHLGTAWNNTVKDSVLRYKRMTGHNVWDRAGYDMHGLPTEQKVLKLHNLRLMQDIAKFGEEKFSDECLKFSTEQMGFMNTDLEKFGVSLDFSDPYQPVTNDYMAGVWQLIKKADEKKRLYRGLRTMGWSAYFQTALAKHEMVYKTVTDTSVFVKFKVKHAENEHLIIWTTTPWTLPFNLAIMVNPQAEYVKAKVDGEVWIVAKDLAGVLIQSVADKQYEIIETLTGEKLAGLEYVHFWSDKMPALKALNGQYDALHTVLLSNEYVDTSGGSGLVHCAPGCGPEDFEVGHKHGLPAFNTIDPRGVFPEDMGFCAQKTAKKDDKFFIQTLEEDGVLVATNPIEHEYPHEERSGEPIIFRTTEQWFFKTEDLKQTMLDYNKDIYWMPQKAKNAFNSWLENLRDNSITKQRFWGTPAPIWVNENDTEDYIVIGSITELQELAVGELPPNLHKPYIDSVKLQRDGKTYVKIPDVLDVWIDSGAASWNSLYNDPKLIEEWFPADFIFEGKDQIRGWFNLLMVASMIMYDKPAFKNVAMHGFIAGVDGEKMSKSLGNIISPYEIADKYGADTMRYYMGKVRAGEDVNFSWDEVTLHYRNLSMMYNVVSYYIDIAKNVGEITKPSTFTVEDKYILSKVHSTIQKITKQFELYELNLVPVSWEELLISISREYIQYVRDQVSIGSDEDKIRIAYVLRECIQTVLTLAHPTVPFITEHLFKRADFGESITYESWPVSNESLIDTTLEEQFVLAGSVIQATLAAREKANLGVRWPVGTITVKTTDSHVKKAVENLKDTILSQTNVKEVGVVDSFEHASFTLKPNYKSLGKEFGQQTADVATAIQTADASEIVGALLNNKPVEIGSFTITKDHVDFEQQVDSRFTFGDFSKGTVYLDTQLTPELEAEGFAREFTRRIQSARKDAGMTKDQTISLSIEVSQTLQDAISAHESAIKDKCGVLTIVVQSLSDAKDVVSGKIKGESFAFTLE